MEQLNQFLQELVSTSGYELHLEPNKNAYVLNAQGQTDVSITPMIGTQISMMVFPLIPPDVKSELPTKPEINFVHPHTLGKFGFTIQKSPAGFNVTVRPIVGDFPVSAPATEVAAEPEPVLETSPVAAPDPQQPAPAMPTFEIESSSFAQQAAPVYEVATEQMLEVEAIPVVETAFSNGPLPEVVSANDPQFQTVFSDTSTYEPPGRRDDFDFDPSSFSSPEITPVQDFAPAQPAQQFHPAVELPEVDRRKTDRRERNLMATARMDALFNQMAEFGASDLHLSVSMPPMIRKDGKMQKLECNEPQLDEVNMRELLVSIMPDTNIDEFDR
jgi:hypothetical protein